MADGKHDPGRRALLGVAVALPLVAGGGASGGASPLHHPSGGSPPRPGEEWSAALSSFREAEAAVRGFEGRCSGLSFEDPTALEGEGDALGDAIYAALRRVMTVRAPDVGALAVKIDLAVAHEVGTLSGGEDCLEALRRDAWALAGVDRVA
jgi:hypothetical protein